MNPSFYQLEETSSDAVNTFLSRVVAKSLAELESFYCIEVEDVSVHVVPVYLNAGKLYPEEWPHMAFPYKSFDVVVAYML